MTYENLPIFRSALELVVYIEQIVKKFEKYNKYTIGVELRQISKELLFLIHRSNISISSNRVKNLEKLRDKCEDLKMLIMVTKELKAFNSFKQFEYSSKLTVETCKQAQAWLNASARVG